MKHNLIWPSMVIYGYVVIMKSECACDRKDTDFIILMFQSIL